MPCLACMQSETCEATRDITTTMDSRLIQLAAEGGTRVRVATPTYDYMTHDIGIECYPGSEVTSMTECQQGATSLGITYASATPIDSKTMPYGCYFYPDGVTLFHNTCSDCGTTSTSSEAICRVVATPGPTLAPWVADGRQYVQEVVGTNCATGQELASLEECQYAATQLTIVFSSSRADDTSSLPYGCNFYYGNLVHNACTTCASTSMYAHEICRIVTTAPTPAPAPLPTPAAAGVSQGHVSASGDPHLQNVHGEHFDLMKPGKHVLIHIPRRAGMANTMLKVEGDVQQMGGPCEMYFQELNVTGGWVNAQRLEGLRFRAHGPRRKADSKWLRLGDIRMKVVHGHTNQGTRYLNFYVKGLSATRLAVGGLLGEDDHTKEATRPRSCGHRVAL